MAEQCGEVPANRRFAVSEPPFIVEGVILLDRIAGRGTQSEGSHIIQRWVLEFLDDVSSLGFENAVMVRAYRQMDEDGYVAVLKSDLTKEDTTDGA